MRIPLAPPGLAGALLVAAGAAAAQQTAGCIGRLRPDLGFSGMTFSQGTTYITNDLTLFGTEPVLSGVSGPSQIREGDVLVAVDGELITTRAGAVRFAGIRPGTPVVLTVRRGGRNQDIRIVPGSRCVPSAAGSVTVEPRPAEPTRRPDSLVAEGAITIGPYPAWAGGPFEGRAYGVSLDRGVLGLGVTCGPCSMKLLPGGRIEWDVRGRPRIDQVASGSAAARAGLRAGDLIESIDGVPIMSAEGGRRFGLLTAGRTVRLGILRGLDHLEVKVVPDRLH